MTRFCESCYEISVSIRAQEIPCHLINYQMLKSTLYHGIRIECKLINIIYESKVSMILIAASHVIILTMKYVSLIYWEILLKSEGDMMKIESIQWVNPLEMEQEKKWKAE